MDFADGGSSVTNSTLQRPVSRISIAETEKKRRKYLTLGAICIILSLRRLARGNYKPKETNMEKRKCPICGRKFDPYGEKRRETEDTSGQIFDVCSVNCRDTKEMRVRQSPRRSK